MSNVENKNYISKKGFQRKRGFALFITIFLVVLFGLFSYRIIENNIFLSNLNTLKYLHLQGNIHLDYVKEYILNNTKEDIDNLSLDDNRYKLEIVQKDENNSTEYYIYIQTIDDTPIRLSHKIIK